MKAHPCSETNVLPSSLKSYDKEKKIFPYDTVKSSHKTVFYMPLIKNTIQTGSSPETAQGSIQVVYFKRFNSIKNHFKNIVLF